jgi:undecaprenyl-diphosphatase
MTFFQALVLGVVQGATEFLPISSSAHLVLVPWILKWELDPEAAFIFDVLVQCGTLVAVIVYFWEDLVFLGSAILGGIFPKDSNEKPDAHLAWMILAASVPAGIAGLTLKRLIASTFESPSTVSVFLLGTAFLLLLSEQLGKRNKAIEAVTIWDALWIGLGQVLSLFPGISRSGATIASGQMRGLRRADAARFSFLMALPVMLGAGAVAGYDLLTASDYSTQIGPLIVGFAAAAVVGYLAIRWLIAYLSRRPLTVFIAYCTIVGLGGLVLGVLRG